MDLFEASNERIDLGPDAFVLVGFAQPFEAALMAAIDDVVERAPMRHMTTARGWTMSVAMTNCGSVGWVSDRRGYRYDPLNPRTSAPWPPIPAAFETLATHAAEAAGFARFVADACLINRYDPGARLALHQDRNERDFSAPIVSVSLGLSATFLWGGASREERPRRVRLSHGDVVVWGGASRLNFHGVDPLRDGRHPLTGSARYNLTLRRAR